MDKRKKKNYNILGLWGKKWVGQRTYLPVYVVYVVEGSRAGNMNFKEIMGFLSRRFSAIILEKSTIPIIYPVQICFSVQVVLKSCVREQND